MSVRPESKQQSIINVSAESLVPGEHEFRKLKQVLDEGKIIRTYKKHYSDLGAPGYPVELGIRALVVQFMQDYSDRQMEKAMAENIAVKWYCGLELTDKTPDHSYFGRFRKRIGTNGVAELFREVTRQFRARGLVGGVFQFVDASAIITKNALWEERDRAIADGLEKLDNAVAPKYAADKDARFGCKGKSKYWFGYKRSVSVDTREGIITKVAVTPANVPDGRALRHILEWEAAALGDKGYCTQAAEQAMAAKGCHSGAIKKKNMKGKNRDKDRFLTRLRMPFEGTFSKMNKRARYRGLAKVQMQAFAQAIVCNLKRGLRLLDIKPRLFQEPLPPA